MGSCLDTFFHMRTLALLGVFVPLFTLIITYSIFLTHTPPSFNDTIIPYVSDTIDYSPTSNIGTLGLGVTVILLLCLYTFKYKYGVLKGEQIDDLSVNMYRLNIANVLMGFISTFCLLGVISFQYHMVPEAHDTFAAIFFFLGVAYTITQTIYDYKLTICTSGIRLYRAIIAALNVIFVIASQGTNYIDGVLCQTLSAGFEIANVVTFFLYFGSFYYEMSRSTFVFEVRDNYQETLKEESM